MKHRAMHAILIVFGLFALIANVIDGDAIGSIAITMLLITLIALPKVWGLRDQG